MANLYKKTYPMSMPKGAEIVTRRGKKVARWMNGRGNEKTAPLHEDGRRMIYVSDVWYARYKDTDGRERRISTGCRDEQAAGKVLSDLLGEVEKVRAGIVTPKELETAEQARRPICEHVADYLNHLKSKRVRGRKVSAHYRRNVKGRLYRLIGECGFCKLSDITSEVMAAWMDEAEEVGLAASTRNEYLGTAKAFCGWLRRSRRLAENPLTDLAKADQVSVRKHVRRALTVDEITRLLHATRLRPIAEVGRKSIPLPDEDKCGRSSWTFDPVTDENLEVCSERGREKLDGHVERKMRLERLGRERAMFYLLAVSTGLRRKELASLTVGQLHLGAIPSSYAELLGMDAKSGRGANIPLRPDVVGELRSYLRQIGDDLPLDRRLFDSPPTIRIFDADCRAAGISKTDSRGRVVDIHALRTTFCTHLVVAGVHPRVAQQAMRHSRMELTNQYYTDPILLDVAGAVNSLPNFTDSSNFSKPRSAIDLRA